MAGLHETLSQKKEKTRGHPPGLPQSNQKLARIPFLSPLLDCGFSLLPEDEQSPQVTGPTLKFKES